MIKLLCKYPKNINQIRIFNWQSLNAKFLELFGIVIKLKIVEELVCNEYQYLILDLCYDPFFSPIHFRRKVRCRLNTVKFVTGLELVRSLHISHFVVSDFLFCLWNTRTYIEMQMDRKFSSEFSFLIEVFKFRYKYLKLRVDIYHNTSKKYIKTKLYIK